MQAAFVSRRIPHTVFHRSTRTCAHCAAGSAGKGVRRGAARAAEADQQADEETAAKNGRPALSALLSLIPRMLCASCSRLIISLLE